MSVFSDARFRGYSLSAGQPVAIVDLSYDDPSGLYAAASASALVSSHEGIKPLGLQLNAGYAKHLSDITIDVGGTHSTYSRYSRGAAASYTEIYAGLTYKFVSSRVAFSPNYFEGGAKTFYGDVEANFSPAAKLHVTGHAGLLIPISDRDDRESTDAEYDWRVGISRDVGRAALHLFSSGGGPGHDFYRGRTHSRTALTVGISWAL